MRIECYGMICLEQFKLFPQMGRFTLRDESEFALKIWDNCQYIQYIHFFILDKTIAIGKVLKVIE